MLILLNLQNTENCIEEQKSCALHRKNKHKKKITNKFYSIITDLTQIYGCESLVRYLVKTNNNFMVLS